MRVLEGAPSTWELPLGPSSPQFHDLLLFSPSLLSSPLASFCLSL